MNMKDKDTLVSVIIPAYNTQDYIGDMLDCVINQTYSNIEIIVVNDGSKDNTRDIIEDKCRDDHRIHLINIPNGGVSNARNLGIQKSKGAKIFFWDSDDIIEPDTIELCLNYSNEHSVNAVLYGYADRVNGVNQKPHVSKLKSKYSGKEVQTELLPKFIGHSFDDVNAWIEGRASMREGKENNALWHMMFDSSTIKKNNLQFDTNLSLGEDTIFNCMYFLHETSVGYLNKCCYYLTMRETGANLTSLRNPRKRIEDKTKLVRARTEVDSLALTKSGFDTHQHWEGTLVFSAIEMALMMSKAHPNADVNFLHLYKSYMGLPQVRKALR